jgi:hypothetical protein
VRKVRRQAAVSDTAIALGEFWVNPWVLKNLFGKLFTVGDGGDKVFTDLSSVLEFAPVGDLE